LFKKIIKKPSTKIVKIVPMNLGLFYYDLLERAWAIQLLEFQ